MRWQLKNSLSLHFDAFDIHYLLLQPVLLENVTLHYTSVGTREVDESHLEEAKQRWNAENDRRSLRGQPALEANLLYRPVTAAYVDGTLTIGAGITTYFDNFYLQTSSDGWDDSTIVGAGLSVVPVCRDEQILIGKRSGVVASESGELHVTGGHAHPTPDFVSVPAILTEAALQELGEEMQIQNADVRQLRFLGLAIDLIRSKPEFIIEADLKEDSAEYISRWQAHVSQEKPADKSQEEFTELRCLDSVLEAKDGAAYGPEEKAPFSLTRFWQQHEHFVPACQAALMAFWLCHSGANTEEIQKLILKSP
jgi:hypothetical protein